MTRLFVLLTLALTLTGCLSGHQAADTFSRWDARGNQIAFLGDWIGEDAAAAAEIAKLAK